GRELVDVGGTDPRHAQRRSDIGKGPQRVTGLTAPSCLVWAQPQFASRPRRAGGGTLLGVALRLLDPREQRRVHTIENVLSLLHLAQRLTRLHTCGQPDRL